MPVLNMIVTDAGRALLAGGTVNITQVGIGSGTWTPTVAATALNTEIKKITAIEGIAAAADMIHITATDSTSDVYTVKEIGLFAGSTLFAIYAQPTAIVSKIADAIALIATDVKFTSVTPGSVTVGAANFGYPQATETTKGVAEIATLAELEAETDDQRIVTSLKLKGFLNRIGSLAMWPAQTPPTGWLERDGSAISRTTYAKLFAVIGTTYGAGNGSTTFNLPDDRGLFERSWDHGRGIDVGRTFGSFQQDAFQNITGALNNVMTGGGSNPGSSGALSYSGSQYGGGAGLAQFVANVVLDTAAAGLRTSTETRPSNRAYLPIIRAY